MFRLASPFYCLLFVLLFGLVSCGQNTTKDPVSVSLEEKPSSDDFHDFDMDNGGDNIKKQAKRTLDRFRSDISSDINFLAEKVGDIYVEDDDRILTKQELLDVANAIEDESITFDFTTDNLFVLDENDEKIDVDATNNPSKKLVSFNLVSWSTADWCERSKLLVHEIMGLLNIEKSLDFSKSDVLKSFIAGCVGSTNHKEYSTLSNSMGIISAYFNSEIVGQLTVAVPHYKHLRNLFDDQFELWFCDTNIGGALFAEHFDYKCVEGLNPKPFLLAKNTYVANMEKYLEFTVNNQDPASERRWLELLRSGQSFQHYNHAKHPEFFTESIYYQESKESFYSNVFFVSVYVPAYHEVKFRLVNQMGTGENQASDEDILLDLNEGIYNPNPYAFYYLVIEDKK